MKIDSTSVRSKTSTLTVSKFLPNRLGVEISTQLIVEFGLQNTVCVIASAVARTLM